MTKDMEMAAFEAALRADIAKTVERYLAITPEWSSWKVLKLIKGE